MSQSPSAVEPAAGPSASSPRKDASVMTESPSAVEPAAGPSASSSRKDASVMTEPPSAVETTAGPSASSSQKEAGPHEIFVTHVEDEIRKLPVLSKNPRQEHEAAAGPSASSSQKEAGPHKIFVTDHADEIRKLPLRFTYARQEDEAAAGPSASSSQKEAGPHEIFVTHLEDEIRKFPVLSKNARQEHEAAGGPSASTSQKDAQPHEILDTDLIEEIKKHPVLFMNAREECEERINKNKPWFEICKLLFKNWNSYSLRKKLDTVKELEQRWVGLVDEFFFKLNDRSKDQPVPKKRKSIFDNMSFLLEPTGYAPDIEAGPEFSGNDFDPLAQSGEINLGIPTQMPTSPVFNNNLQQQQQFTNVSVPSTSSASLGRKSANVHFTSLVTSLLNDLDKDQNLVIWRDILQLIQEAGERGSCSKQHDLIYVPGMGAEPSLVAPAEEAAEGEASASYPTPERPRNADGQLIYPETDEEDVEV